MSQILKLRYCRYLMTKIHRHACKKSFNKYTDSFMPLIRKIQEQNNFKHALYACSFQPIREFAKKGGKGQKGGSKPKKMQLSDEEMTEVIDVHDYRQQLNQVIEKLKREYVENLSIRSAVGNIENIVVKIGEDEYPLNELAVISKKNPNLVAINMNDFPEALKPAIQAILDSGSGFNPQQEGTMIYLAIPKMTREHRENLAKSAKTLFTKSKEEIRSVQNSFIKEAKEKTGLSEDLVFSATCQIMAMAENCVSDLDKIMKSKQKELLGEN